MNLLRTRQFLQEFNFADLFILELGWPNPEDDRKLIIPNPAYVEPAESGAAPMAPAESGAAQSYITPAQPAPIDLAQPALPPYHAALRHAAPDQPQPAKLYGEIIAQLAHVPVIQIECKNRIFSADIREKISQKVAEYYYKHLLIFVTKDRTCSLWYWEHHTHWYFKGQPGYLFLSKLSEMVFSMSDLEKSDPTVREVCQRLQNALDVSQVVKKFFDKFKGLFEVFADSIQGIDDLKKQNWYASVVLTRIIFIYFLQKKGFLDHQNFNYLRTKLESTRASKGLDLYYKKFLMTLFLKGFAIPEDKRTDDEKNLLGDIHYLNGGLFLEHEIEIEYRDKIQIPDSAFFAVFELLDSYTWHLDDTPGANDSDINPSVLGYIFEKWVNDRSFGAYYTCDEITNYLCEQTVARVIMEKVSAIYGADQFDDVHDVIAHLNAPMAQRLVMEILPSIKILDPACGSGAFLLATMKTLFEIYCAIVSKDFFEKDNHLRKWRDDLLPKPKQSKPNTSGDQAGSGANLSGGDANLSGGGMSLPGSGANLSGGGMSLPNVASEHGRPVLDPRIAYMLKKQIIVNNLYGVDIMKSATEIARLRLFLGLVAEVERLEYLEPLPNIDFNIMAGNSLIGLMQVKNQDFDTRWKKCQQITLQFQANHCANYQELLAEKQRLINNYRNADKYAEDLTELRDNINKQRTSAQIIFNDILLEIFSALEIEFEQITWDTQKNKQGKSKKRAVTIEDIAGLNPFHWGFEFDEIMQRGGFDVVLANPPWEIFKPQSKEFFLENCKHKPKDTSDPNEPQITKKKMKIHDFEREQERLLQDKKTLAEWEAYLSKFPHVSEYFRKSPQYPNQISMIQSQPDEDGNPKKKKAGTDINLYKLFLEQCFHLLRPNGQCGVVIPSGIYTDLGTKQLRQMLFQQTQITGLFCFENRRGIFERVVRQFKFVVLSFQKSSVTVRFLAAFMRHDVKELGQFLKQYAGYRKGLDAKQKELGVVMITTDLIRQFSPDSLSIMEFKTALDFSITEKMLRFPLLGKKLKNTWNISLTREFDMTNDSDLFQSEPGLGCLPLYEGKMIHQFCHNFASPRYWIDEQKGRAKILGREKDTGQVLDYQMYRLGFRGIARNTDQRTLIATITPYTFHGNSLPVVQFFDGRGQQIPCYLEQLFLCTVWNSFILDAMLRMKVSANINFFYIYQLPVPRLTPESKWFAPIVIRSARLICTTPEFDALGQDIGLPLLSGGKSLPGSGNSPVAPVYGITDPAERESIRAELDGLIAHLYGLTRDEFEYILTTFPQVEDRIKQKTLTAYNNLIGHLPE